MTSNSVSLALKTNNKVHQQLLNAQKDIEQDTKGLVSCILNPEDVSRGRGRANPFTPTLNEMLNALLLYAVKNFDWEEYRRKKSIENTERIFEKKNINLKIAF